MNAKTIGWSAFGVAAFFIVLIFFAQQLGRSAASQSSVESASASAGSSSSRANAQATPSQIPVATASPSSSDIPTPTGTKIVEGNRDGAQAPQSYTPKANARQKITQPKIPTPDAQKPEEVGEAFLIAYNSRTDEKDLSWQETTQPWVTSGLQKNLTEFTNPALEGLGATSAGKVKIGENFAKWGIDTPVRWAHWAEVTVKTETGGTFVLTFQLRAQLTDDGWKLNSAHLDSWRKIVD